MKNWRGRDFKDGEGVRVKRKEKGKEWGKKRSNWGDWKGRIEDRR